VGAGQNLKKKLSKNLPIQGSSAKVTRAASRLQFGNLTKFDMNEI
jgi:hypothetical protein